MAGSAASSCQNAVSRGWPAAVMAPSAWNAGFSRHSPPQAGGESDLIRRDGSAARAHAPGVAAETPAALRAAVPAEAGVPSPCHLGPLLAGALFMALLAPIPAAAQEWQQAAPDYPWEFPNDHWAHVGYRTEWWYLVGFADAADGSRCFAWQFTLFRTGLTLTAPSAAPSPWGTGHVAMGHAAVADLETGERVFTQTVHREAPGLVRFGAHPDPEIAWMRGPPGTTAPWFLTYRDGGFHFGAADSERGLRMELHAVSARDPWLHGEAGHSPKSEGGAASYYYSHPRLEVTGSLGLGGENVEIAGSGWLDREFGSSWLAAGQTGWDWFGLNLRDGRDLMLYLLRRRDGSLSYSDGTLRDAGGDTSRRVRGAGVEVLETWMPPDLDSDPGNARPYPAGWRLRIPGEDLDLIVRPLLPNQENRRPAGLAGPDIPYWEGAVRVEPAGSGASGTPRAAGSWNSPDTGRTWPWPALPRIQSKTHPMPGKGGAT